MLQSLRSRLTYANVVATVAVFLALGGSSYAVGERVPRRLGRRRRMTRWSRATYVVLLVGCLAVPSAASAATVSVTRGDDPELDDPSGCSLRQAIQAANTNAAVGACMAGEMGALDTIELPTMVRLTRLGADDGNVVGDLDVLAGGPLRVVGTGAVPSSITQTVTQRVLDLVAGTLTLERVAVTGGRAGLPTPVGGGILARALTTLSVISSTVSGNGADFMGGGISNGTRGNMEVGGEVLIVNSTVSGNTSDLGAGVANVDGTLTLVNSTVSGNEGVGRGGGLYNEAINGISAVDVVNSTVAGNAGTGGASLHNSGNGGTDAFRLRSTIMSNPRNDSHCGRSGNATPFTSLGYNLADDDSCALNGPTDQPSTNALLGPLAANGGLTLTHAPLAGSPAIDRGTSDSTLAGVGVLMTDQRALPRPFDFPEIANAPAGDSADVGAVELQAPPPPDPPVKGPPPHMPPAVPSDTSVRIGIADKRLRVDRRRVGRLRLTCPRTEQSPPCRGTLTLRTRGRVRFRGARRQVALARASFRIPAGRTAAVRLRLASAVVALVRRSRRARQAVATASVRDAAGNRATVRTRVQVVPPTRTRPG